MGIESLARDILEYGTRNSEKLRQAVAVNEFHPDLEKPVQEVQHGSAEQVPPPDVPALHADQDEGQRGSLAADGMVDVEKGNCFTLHVYRIMIMELLNKP